jgi:NlpC/P60 family putative phage cell wall peptidase
MHPPITRDRVVRIARSWRGTPYHHQQSIKHFGTDCLGLVRGIWRDLYGSEPEQLPAYSSDWAEASGDEALLAAARRHLVEIDRKSAREGDLLVFRHRKWLPAKHIGVLTAHNRMIHATENLPVMEFKLTGWWTCRVAGAFSFPHVV